MALNQVLNAKDEIKEGTSKYFITDNSDGTKGITLANEIIQEGTEINKTTLDRIDNVLSNIVPECLTEETRYEKINTTSILPTQWTSATESGMSSAFVSGEFKITCDTPNSSGKILSLAFDGIKDNNGNSSWQSSNSSVKDVNFYITYDIPRKLKKVSFYSIGNQNGSTNTLYGSNDNLTWTPLCNVGYIVRQETLVDIENPDYYKYYKIEIKGETTGWCYLDTGTQFEREWVEYTSYYKNHFVLDNNSADFKNNQIIYIETPKQKYNFERTEDLSPVVNFFTGTLSSSGSEKLIYSKKIDMNELYSSFIVSFRSSNSSSKAVVKAYLYNGDEIVAVKSQQNLNTSFYNFTFDFSDVNTCYYDDLTLKITANSYVICNQIDANKRIIFSTNENNYMEFKGNTLENTLNNIPISTLIYPSCKYILKYNENENTFETIPNNIEKGVVISDSINSTGYTGPVTNSYFNIKQFKYLLVTYCKYHNSSFEEMQTVIFSADEFYDGGTVSIGKRNITYKNGLLVTVTTGESPEETGRYRMLPLYI